MADNHTGKEQREGEKSKSDEVKTTTENQKVIIIDEN